MSKLIKRMEMDSLKQTFGDVRDVVVLSFKGVDNVSNNLLRLNLRKKQVRLHVVKNSFIRKVFDEIGIKVGADSPYWTGNSVLAWGAGSPAELSRTVKAELDEITKKNPKLKDKFTIKGGIAEGLEVPFDVMVKMPTRVEAIGRIISLALSPAQRVAGQITSPAARLAAQVKTISEKEPPAESAPAEKEAPAESTPAT